MSRPLVLAITGASGAAYSVRLLQQLLLAGKHLHVTISPSGATVIKQELGLEIDLAHFDAAALLEYYWPTEEHRWLSANSAIGNVPFGRLDYSDYRDFMSPIASGSYLTDGMIICPCSGTTLSGIVHASSTNLIQRAAEVHLKEHRKLILVPRETPLSTFQIENMQRAATAGAIVLPAMPGWYHGVESIVDLIDFVVARIMDHLQIPHHLISRWGDVNQFAVAGDE